MINIRMIQDNEGDLNTIYLIEAKHGVKTAGIRRASDGRWLILTPAQGFSVASIKKRSEKPLSHYFDITDKATLEDRVTEIEMKLEGIL